MKWSSLLGTFIRYKESELLWIDLSSLTILYAICISFAPFGLISKSVIFTKSLPMTKHSSFLGTFIHYEENKVLGIDLSSLTFFTTLASFGLISKSVIFAKSLPMTKHSSLLGTFTSYKENKVSGIGLSLPTFFTTLALGGDQGDHRGHAGEVGGTRQDDGSPLLRPQRRRGPRHHGRNA
jgi:hypothetical protein